jgi:hypothetical protein
MSIINLFGPAIVAAAIATPALAQAVVSEPVIARSSIPLRIARIRARAKALRRPIGDDHRSTGGFFR